MPIDTIIRTDRFVTGWFALLSEPDAKTSNVYCGAGEHPDPATTESCWDDPNPSTPATPSHASTTTTTAPPHTLVAAAAAGASLPRADGVAGSASTGKCNEDVVARYKYTATQKDELSFDVGDVIHVSEKRPSGWWAGCVALLSFYPFSSP